MWACHAGSLIVSVNSVQRIGTLMGGDGEGTFQGTVRGDAETTDTLDVISRWGAGLVASQRDTADEGAEERQAEYAARWS